MAIIKLKVIYADGQEKTVQVTPRAEVMAEEKFAGLASGSAPLQTVFFLAWASLHRAGKEADDFDAFIDKIADVEDVTTEQDENPTTGAEPPLAPSSN